MAFDNPALPHITLEECKAALPKAQQNLIQAARQTEPRLSSAPFVSARCVMSADDPIKPR